jgi:Fic family protein
MEVLLEKLGAVKDPVHGGILGHYGLVAIHPYPDGNGRLSRFLMNLFFAKAKAPWTVILSERRTEYFGALEKIATEKSIGPFARFVFSSIPAA